MAEPVWYYAKGDAEQGPITGAQIKALARAGKIRADDLVWKEGMSDWRPAREVRGLFPDDSPPRNKVAEPPAATPTEPVEPPPSETATEVQFIDDEAEEAAQEQPSVAAFTPAEPSPVAATPKIRVALPTDSKAATRQIGSSALLVGIMFVMLAKGCDSLGDRYVARLQANAEIAAAENNEDQYKLREAANAGRSTNEAWAYYRQMSFVFGSMILAGGLLAVGLTSEGPERWICYAVLGLILASIYFGGGSWGGK